MSIDYKLIVNFPFLIIIIMLFEFQIYNNITHTDSVCSVIRVHNLYKINFRNLSLLRHYGPL